MRTAIGTLRRTQADGQCARVLAGVAYDDPKHPGGRRQPNKCSDGSIDRP